MYPDRPQSNADLVPLPQCDGPKLKAFDFQGPQKIEFLEHVGDGIHSYVFKVKIRDHTYALKLFRFTSDESWVSPADKASENNHEALSTFYPYSEPFNCECRAFGRLQEAGHEELATKCFGYVLLDDENEKAMMDKFADLVLNFNYDGIDPGHRDMRSRFLCSDGNLPPIRGIVKEFGDADGDLDNRSAKRLLQDIKHIQQLGIVDLDVGYRQIISGKLSDFSTALTIPHFISNPEWNPHLTPDWIPHLEFELFTLSYKDYRDFDIMVYDWNVDSDKKVTVRALPEGYPPERRQLRNTPGRGRLYTYVDPRHYKKYLPDTNRTGAAARDRKGRIAKRNKRSLAVKPPLWFIDSETAAARRLKQLDQLESTVHWQYQNGNMAPLERF
ncbi:hypothetical protein IL306_000988 [Fusarium sp. DS 682]|nr:hypothetical protein IL306_000988 [Fusarium sp. DS 682]